MTEAIRKHRRVGRMSAIGLSVLVGVFVLACGAAPTESQAPVPLASATSPEDQLQQRADAAAGVLTARDWLAYAQLASSSLLEGCPADRLATLVAMERLSLRSLLDIGDEVALTVRVEDVETTDVDGTVTLVLVADGESLDGTASTDRWITDGGEWRLDDDSWREACSA